MVEFRKMSSSAVRLFRLVSRLGGSIVLIGSAGLLTGQQPATVFRAGAKLVEVTVTVLDKKGHAVNGLESADFTVLDEGKPRPVAFFRFDGGPETAPATAPPPALPPGVFSNLRAAATEGRPRNITALVIDTLNTDPQHSIAVRAQMMRYLRALAPETRVAVYQMGVQLRILHDFTDDPAALRAKLEKAVMGMPMATVTDYRQSVVEAEAFVDMFAGDPAMQAQAEDIARRILEFEGMSNAALQRDRMEYTLAQLEALGRHLAAIPGRKNLVWIGSGISMLAITGSMGMGVHGSVESYESKVKATSQRLAQQGITLYIVDAKGLELPSDTMAQSRAPVPVRGRGRFEPQMDAAEASSDTRPAMGMMAQITGGRYFHNTNDLAVGFKQTVTDTQGSYTIGFYMPGEADNKWHKLKVKVKRPKTEVIHRQGYLAESGRVQPAEWTLEAWRAAFSSPIVSTVIPLSAQCELTASGGLALTLMTNGSALDFQPDGENIKAKVEIGIADRAADGGSQFNRAAMTAVVPAAKSGELGQQAITYHRQWKPVEGTTNLRIILRDLRSGNFGTLDVPVDNLPRQVEKSAGH
jgi:VWFA-related protein